MVGPAGSGKSAALRLVAAEAEIKIREWNAPVPMLWKEFKHMSALDTNYSSKVDDFGSFVARASKYSLLKLEASQISPSSIPFMSLNSEKEHRRHETDIILLVEDVPLRGSKEQQQHVLDLLQRLTRESRTPTAIVFSEEDLGSRIGELQDYSIGISTVIRVMVSAGARYLSFNSSTVTRLVKALTSIAHAERLTFSPVELMEIAIASKGDVRCAITSLQLLACGVKGVSVQSKESHFALADMNRMKIKACASLAGDDDIRSVRLLECRDNLKVSEKGNFCRDHALSAFHALGKVLYNKRCLPVTKASMSEAPTNFSDNSFDKKLKSKRIKFDGFAEGMFSLVSTKESTSCILQFGNDVGPFCVHPQLQRHPLSNDPEWILFKSKLNAVAATSFLYENFLDFLPNEAVKDAALGIRYLSDAVILLKRTNEGLGGHDRGGLSSHIQFDRGDSPTAPTSVRELAAGSVSTRGVFFAPSSTHATPRRWHQLRAPQGVKATRVTASNMQELRAFIAEDFSISSNLAAAVETLPMLRVIALCTPKETMRVPYLPFRWTNFDDEQCSARRDREYPASARHASWSGEVVSKEAYSWHNTSGIVYRSSRAEPFLNDDSSQQVRINITLQNIVASTGERDDIEDC